MHERKHEKSFTGREKWFFKIANTISCNLFKIAKVCIIKYATFVETESRKMIKSKACHFNTHGIKESNFKRNLEYVTFF